jgi:prepilin-type N-terminal cleavage/methylation domain-containing protein
MSRRAFSLVEILIVILIMGVLVGVVGSLMSGFVSSFEATDDQSIARRRAQDVFNILQMPVLNAGMGLPGDHFDWYFVLNGHRAPVASWDTPLSVSGTDGDILRVVYSVPTGVKNGTTPGMVDDFSAKPPGYVPDSSTFSRSGVTLTKSLPAGVEGVIAKTVSTPLDMRAFVTFPGIHMHPLYVTNIDVPRTTITLAGKKPYEVVDSEDVMPRNVIYPYHDIFKVRAAVAYVDSNSTFCFADVGTNDITGKPNVSTFTNAPAFRVEGIKAVKFERDSDGRTLTVSVIAEGDTVDSSRGETAQLQNLKARWPHITTFEPDKYYEDFSITWRTRNVETPTP